jgi:hypothetical protein
VLDGGRARDPREWAEGPVVDAVRQASAQVALVDEDPPTYALPSLRVTTGAETTGGCGAPDPPVAGAGEALSITILGPADSTGCPVRVDLYRSDGAVDGVVLYPASPPGQ